MWGKLGEMFVIVSDITFLVTWWNTDIFLNQVIQLYSNNATNLRRRVAPQHRIVTWPQITVTSLHPRYCLYGHARSWLLPKLLVTMTATVTVSQKLTISYARERQLTVHGMTVADWPLSLTSGCPVSRQRSHAVYRGSRRCCQFTPASRYSALYLHTIRTWVWLTQWTVACRRLQLNCRLLRRSWWSRINNLQLNVAVCE